MITNKDLATLSLSPTNKDFVQIWNELLEVAGKLSARWDPTSTNESDPGIVLLKALAGIADKLNYNIDKNILEAYMPTAAQKESMYKLCDMMGYNIKYYRSAETVATVWYTKPLDDKIIEIPPFTVLSNSDDTIYFVTTNSSPVKLSAGQPKQFISCIEGSKIDCTSVNFDDTITMAQLTSDNRFYLPELQIAENGVFVQNFITKTTSDSVTSDYWQSVTNLNTHPQGQRIFKFSYDSFLKRPYLQFPEDIADLIQDGLKIAYIRTSGANGNIAVRTLTKITLNNLPEGVSTDNFVVLNENVTSNGANIETISEAYNNFKKTVGTFETLVTCRDYMNAIYNMMEEDISIDQKFATPLVSNINVTDIRTDINRAVTICSMDEFGIKYLEQPLVENDNAAISHFDLVLYPFKTYYPQTASSSSAELSTRFKNSFKADLSSPTILDIKEQLKNVQTIAHNIVEPRVGDILCIRNYLQLNALIATSTKVQTSEGNDIIKNIKLALVNEFNMRNLDFGEEIPFDSILKTIENADARIKVVALQEPKVLTKVVVRTNTGETEYEIANSSTNVPLTAAEAKKVYNKLVLRNILAGRVPLFDYSKDIQSDFGEYPYTALTPRESDELPTPITWSPIIENEVFEATEASKTYYQITKDQTTNYYEATSPTPSYPSSEDKITKLEGKFIIESVGDTGEYVNIKLGPNEQIQFRAPNLITEVTYPAYVNYYWKPSATNTDYAEAAVVQTLASYLSPEDSEVKNSLWDAVFNCFVDGTLTGPSKHLADCKFHLEATGGGETPNQANAGNLVPTAQTWDRYKCIRRRMWTSGSDPEETDYYYTFDNFDRQFKADLATTQSGNQIYYEFCPLTSDYLTNWNNFIKTREDLAFEVLTYKSSSRLYPIGEFVDSAGYKYNQFLVITNFDRFVDKSSPFEDCYVLTEKGLNGVPVIIKKGTEYQLQGEEKLFINYTSSATDEHGVQVEGSVINKVYTAGTIIRPTFDLKSTYFLIENEEKAKVKEIDFEGEPSAVPLVSLGANESIEIRSLSQVTPGKPAAGTTTALKIYHNFDWPTDKATYTLKQNEYLFVSDQYGLDAAYYGYGSEIKCNKRILFGASADLDLNIVEVLQEGLHLIPWRSIIITSEDYFTITEYQYKTLSEGDTLCSASRASSVTRDSSQWHAVTNVEYKTDLAETLLTLPIYALLNYTWEMCSVLMLDTIGPSSQTLRYVVPTTDSNSKAYDQLKVYTENKPDTGDGTGGELIKPDEINTTISFRTSYECYAPTGIFEVSEDEEKTYGVALKVNIFEPGDLVVASTATPTPKVSYKLAQKLSSLSGDDLTNFGYTVSANTGSPKIGSESINNIWTKFSGINLWPNASEKNSLLLPVNISAGTFGIFSMFIKASASSTDTIILTSDKTFEIFQNLDLTGGDDEFDNGYKIQLSSDRLLTFKITESCTISLSIDPSVKFDNAKQMVFMYDRLRIVNKGVNGGINQTLLNYCDIDGRSEAELLLDDIQQISNNKFYYTTPIENALAIELFENSVPRTMQTPEIYYDVNNINNHFVISALDVDYLDTGIVIAKSSKY